MSDADEAAIIGRLRAGAAGRDDWSRLVGAYQHRVFAVCVRMVRDREAAADLCQDTLVKVVQSIGTFDGGSRFSTWVIRIAMNRCLTHLRAAKVRNRVHPRGLAGEESTRTGGNLRPSQVVPRTEEPGPGLSVEVGEDREVLGRALAELDPEQRAILVLRDVQGLDYQQIAATLDVAEGTVKSRLFRARLALRAKIEGQPVPRARDHG